jgi:GTP-binding protein
VQQHPGALDVAQEAVAQPRALGGALDEAGDVGQDEAAAVLEPDDAQVGRERRERVVGDLGLGARDAGEEGRLAGVGIAEEPGVGEERWIDLELKLIADIGLVGQPNAGKSTLLAALTAATPRIGNYPFTTTTPNLGVVELPNERMAVLADVPGLIEGAHAGQGLGHEFLRHVERTRVLVGVVDGAADDPVAEWQVVADELRLHDASLLERPMPLVVTKLDLPEVQARWPDLRSALTRDGTPPIGISAHDTTGLDELRLALAEALDASDEAQRQEIEQAEVLVHRFDPLDQGWEVVAEADGLRVRGRRIEEAANRTNFDNEESRERFQRLLERLGIEPELRRMGAGDGSTVRIGRAELEWSDDE